METTKISLRIFFLLVLFSQCNNSEIIGIKQAEDLINNTMVTKEDQSFDIKSKLLNRFINQEHQIYWAELTVFIDSSSMDVSNKFIIHDKEIPEISPKYIVDLKIDNFKIIINNHDTISLDSLSQFIVEMVNKAEHTANDKKVLQPFLDINVSEKQELSSEEWRFVFSCMNQIINGYSVIKRDYALKKWGKDYTQLSFDQKIEVNDIVYAYLLVYLK